MADAATYALSMMIVAYGMSGVLGGFLYIRIKQPLEFVLGMYGVSLIGGIAIVI